MVDLEPPQPASDDQKRSRSTATGHRELKFTPTCNTIKTADYPLLHAGLLSGNRPIISPITACDIPFFSKKFAPNPGSLSLRPGLGAHHLHHCPVGNDRRIHSRSRQCVVHWSHLKLNGTSHPWRPAVAMARYSSEHGPIFLGRDFCGLHGVVPLVISGNGLTNQPIPAAYRLRRVFPHIRLVKSSP